MKGEIKQICILVKDVYETMRNFWEILEIGPWEVRHFNPRNCSYFEVDGKELTEGFDFIAAVAWAGEIEFELVQPIEGPNVYWDVLDKKGRACIILKWLSRVRMSCRNTCRNWVKNTFR